ncbi:MAG TPA: glycosyltransferase [Solirubrobacterales bacterium]|nr:glycosyltransferase [Solirubrobacterales bacterium]
MLADRPLISVVVPTYETEPRHLRDAIGSVRAQSYPDWELVIVDDGSTRADTRRVVTRAVSRDPRITARFLERNAGISAATNAGLELCRGELVAFLDHDDTLAPDALLRVAQAFGDGHPDVIYTDQDKLTADGRLTDPFLKPDWSPVYALGAMYVGHLLVARRDLIAEAGGLDPKFDTIQDFELLLRLSERTDRIHHIPEILYHWRAIPGSIALGEEEKEGVTELQARSVNAHLERRGIGTEAAPHPSIPHRLRLRPRSRRSNPTVDVVTPTRRQAGPFNPGRQANLAAGGGDGEFIVFLGEQTEVVEPDWIEQLLLYAELPGVGAVGPTIVHPDGRVSAAGVAIGLYDPATPVMRDFESDGDGYYGALSVAREVSAVGMECMLVGRSLFDRVGRFEEAYSREFQAYDLCLKLRQAGASTICTPAPRTIDHTTEAQRRSDFDVLDRALFVDRWYEQLAAGDPYYGRGFLREAADFRPSPFSGDELELAMREAAR